MARETCIVQNISADRTAATLKADATGAAADFNGTPLPTKIKKDTGVEADIAAAVATGITRITKVDIEGALTVEEKTAVENLTKLLNARKGAGEVEIEIALEDAT